MVLSFFILTVVNNHIVFMDSEQAYEMTSEQDILPLKSLCLAEQNVEHLKMSNAGEIIAKLGSGGLGNRSETLVMVSPSSPDEVIQMASESDSRTIVDLIISGSGIYFIDSYT